MGTVVAQALTLPPETFSHRINRLYSYSDLGLALRSFIGNLFIALIVCFTVMLFIDYLRNKDKRIFYGKNILLGSANGLISAVISLLFLAISGLILSGISRYTMGVEWFLITLVIVSIPLALIRIFSKNLDKRTVSKQTVVITSYIVYLMCWYFILIMLLRYTYPSPEPIQLYRNTPVMDSRSLF